MSKLFRAILQLFIWFLQMLMLFKKVDFCWLLRLLCVALCFLKRHLSLLKVWSLNSRLVYLRHLPLWKKNNNWLVNCRLKFVNCPILLQLSITTKACESSSSTVAYQPHFFQCEFSVEICKENLFYGTNMEQSLQQILDPLVACSGCASMKLERWIQHSICLNFIDFQ